ncbi:MAG TPA: cutinase family protein [Mycobacterium sp.]|nr:cutinase family protein [Mycobacterium sp.]
MHLEPSNPAVFRTARRWATLGSAALLAAGVLVVAPSLVPSALPPATAYDCPQAEVIFARGTGEPAGIGRVGEAFVDSLRQQTPLDVDVYAVNYPAGKLQLHGTDGANDAINRIRAAADQCPDTQLVLGGYSQGASVVDIVTGTPVLGRKWGNPLPAEYAGQIAAVATFGNPADRDTPISKASPLFAAKAIDLCNPGDPICHDGPGNEWNDHTDGYIPAYTSQAANFVAGKLAAGNLPGPPPAG